MEEELKNRVLNGGRGSGKSLRLLIEVYENRIAELESIKDVATLIRSNNSIVVTLLQLNNKLVFANQQIEKMKCGGNCKHLYHVNTGNCYDAKCDLAGCDCTNCKDEWEFRG